MTRKEYIKNRAKSIGKSQRNYENDMKVNYVIFHNPSQTTDTWAEGEDEGLPVVYGDKADVENIISSLNAKNGNEEFSIMTEDEYITNYFAN